MKKMKFKLDELKVNSFVTSLRDSESGAIKGGTELSCPHNCLTREFNTCGVHTLNVNCQTPASHCC